MDEWFFGIHDWQSGARTRAMIYRCVQSNDEGTSGWSSSVSGTTSANVAPVIASISPLTVAENSTAALVTVRASDTDTDDDITGYGIVDDADGSQFSIGASTGVLSFKTAPNYEDPVDVLVADPSSGAGDNEYIVVVVCDEWRQMSVS